jgi:hypothetical protein
VLVPFVIDINSLTPEPDWTPAQQRACSNGVLDIWQRIGLLAHDGDELTGSKLFQAIQKLPQKIRPQWQEMLTRLPMLITPGWDGNVVNATVKDFATTARLALVNEVWAEAEFNIDEENDEVVVQANGIDVAICRIIAASHAQEFQKALAISGTHIEAGDTFQKIWDCRFNTLAKAPIKLVTIVDRYAVGQHISHSQADLSGLERFLRLLDNSASGPRHLALYSAWTAELSGENRKTIHDIDTEIREVFGRLPKKNIKRLKILMASNTEFRDDGHDRFVRFGDYVWDIGMGLEVFDGAFASSRSSAGFNTGLVVDSYKQVETDLSGHRDTKTCEIR